MYRSMQVLRYFKSRISTIYTAKDSKQNIVSKAKLQY